MKFNLLLLACGITVQMANALLFTTTWWKGKMCQVGVACVLSSDHGYTVKEHEEGLHIEVVYNCFIIIPLDGVVIWQLYTLKIST